MTDQRLAELNQQIAEQLILPAVHTHFPEAMVASYELQPVTADERFGGVLHLTHGDASVQVVVVDALGTGGTESVPLRIRDVGDLGYEQGTTGYFVSIVEAMVGRGETDVASALVQAAAGGRLLYLLVEAKNLDDGDNLTVDVSAFPIDQAEVGRIPA